jgi:hypothetical protein
LISQSRGLGDVYKRQLIGASNTLESSGSMGSQMRCTDMLEKVAKDSNKIARLVAGES